MDYVENTFNHNMRFHAIAGVFGVMDKREAQRAGSEKNPKVR